MQTISDSVGFKGANKKSDVALVQAILLETPCLPNGTNTKTPTYLTSHDGDCGNDTHTALRCFQGVSEVVMAITTQGGLHPYCMSPYRKVSPHAVHDRDSSSLGAARTSR